MVIMSEWVYGNGKRQRRGEAVSNVFSVKFSFSLAAAASSPGMHLCRLITCVTQIPSVVCIQQILVTKVSLLAVN